MAEFPFSRAKALGWAYGEVLTSSQMNTADDNAASGAPGVIYTDFAVGRTWIDSVTVANHGRSPIWRPDDTASVLGGKWISFGVSGGNPLVATSRNFGAWTTGISITAGDGLTPPAHGGSAVKPDGSIVIVGGTPGIASRSKIRYSGAGSSTFSAADVTASGTEGVACAVWHAGTSRFYVGLDNSATTNIEYSADGITWTQVTGLPNSNARGNMATDGNIIVCLPSSSTNTCITSTNGTTWTQRSLPASTTWGTVLWDSRYDRFVALGSGTNIAYSSDGITWSAGTSADTSPRIAAIYGRVIVGVPGSASEASCGYFDGSALQVSKVLDLATNVRGVAYGEGQFLITDTNAAHYRSFCGASPA